MKNQDELNEDFVVAGHCGDFDQVKLLIEQGADIHYNCDEVLNAKNNWHLEIVKYLIIDLNMTIREETLKWLKANNLLEIIGIINTRDLYKQLDNDLINNIIDIKHKQKI
jgi:hypothetical protein